MQIRRRFFRRKKIWNGIELFKKSPQDFFKKVQRIFRPMRKDYQSRFQMTLDQYLRYHQRNISWKELSRWMGTIARKNPFDAWIYQEILYKVKPKSPGANKSIMPSSTIK